MPSPFIVKDSLPQQSTAAKTRSMPRGKLIDKALFGKQASHRFTVGKVVFVKMEICARHEFGEIVLLSVAGRNRC